MSHCPTCQMPVFKNEQICRRCGTDLEAVMPEGGGLLGRLRRLLFQGWHPTGAKTLIVGSAFLLAAGLSYWIHVSEQRQLEARQAAERRLIEERTEAERRRAAAEQKAAAEKIAAEQKAAAEKTAAEKAAAEKAAAEQKAAAEKTAAEKAAA
ncbi:MAG: hypothetical protein HQL97_14020, partial [Magnetococcales bacterium]|nr:hypothetical protein [Magnetococcales bacterium]